MKKNLFFCVAGLFLSFAILLSISNAEEVKIKLAIVDLYRVINESEPGKKAKSELESLIRSKQSAIEEKGKNIEALKADIDKQSAVITAEAKKAKEEELERLIKDYQRLVSDSQSEVRKKESELTNEILKQAREVINKIAKEGGYSLVLEKADGLVLYYTNTLEITDKVIKRVNEIKSETKKAEPKSKPSKN
ncbi:MAG: OmpH family outer membrane protein [Thermodesulfovibrionales bacterium]|nr:OmpH family outer membrane protein [Thermodesulfovibrionales bacterium]